MSEMWNSLHHLFDTDDGSLPEIEIIYKDGTSIASAYAFLRDHSSNLLSENSTYYLFKEKRTVKIKHADNPAKLVAKGIAESYHIVFTKIKSPKGKPVPDLGVLVWENGLGLDYRMGNDWNTHSLDGFFEILLALSKLPKFEGISTPLFSKTDAAIFMSEWDKFFN